jgi:hypothetical protein
MADVTFSGGEKLAKVLREAGRGGIKSVDVGVFASAKYTDGTPVAAVAAWNEFGTATIPERPAIRIANKENEKVLIRLIKNTVDPEKMIITKDIGGLIGANHQGATQQSITKLRDPANAASTIKLKGSSNPLIAEKDTISYKKSITFKVNG